MSEQLILDKLDDIRSDVAELRTEVALNNQSYKNLNAEMQEHKRDDKWIANRNIAIIAIMFTALGCWVGWKGINTAKHVGPTAIIKEISSNDRNSNNNREHSRVEG